MWCDNSPTNMSLYKNLQGIIAHLFNWWTPDAKAEMAAEEAASQARCSSWASSLRLATSMRAPSGCSRAVAGNISSTRPHTEPGTTCGALLSSCTKNGVFSFLMPPRVALTALCTELLPLFVVPLRYQHDKLEPTLYHLDSLYPFLHSSEFSANSISKLCRHKVYAPPIPHFQFASEIFLHADLEDFFGKSK